MSLFQFIWVLIIWSLSPNFGFYGMREQNVYGLVARNAHLVNFRALSYKYDGCGSNFDISVYIIAWCLTLAMYLCLHRNNLWTFHFSAHTSKMNRFKRRLRSVFTGGHTKLYNGLDPFGTGQSIQRSHSYLKRLSRYAIKLSMLKYFTFNINSA